MWFVVFLFSGTRATEIYTLSLHDALPIWQRPRNAQPHRQHGGAGPGARAEALESWCFPDRSWSSRESGRSEEHTSELQSRGHLVCRLLLEKKKKDYIDRIVCVECITSQPS